MFPMEHIFLEPLIMSYDHLKALWHLVPFACLAFSSAPAMVSR